jgi:lauroyl/myristoyl acyltransferase
VEHVRDRYGKVLGMTKEQQKKRTNKNMEMINEEMRKKNEGATLPEKIEKLIEKIKKKEVVSHMNDTFYEECVDQGTVYYLRRTDL